MHHRLLIQPFAFDLLPHGSATQFGPLNSKGHHFPTDLSKPLLQRLQVRRSSASPWGGWWEGKCHRVLTLFTKVSLFRFFNTKPYGVQAWVLISGVTKLAPLLLLTGGLAVHFEERGLATCCFFLCFWASAAFGTERAHFNVRLCFLAPSCTNEVSF